MKKQIIDVKKLYVTITIAAIIKIILIIFFIPLVLIETLIYKLVTEFIGLLKRMYNVINMVLNYILGRF